MKSHCALSPATALYIVIVFCNIRFNSYLLNQLISSGTAKIHKIATVNC